MPSSHLILCHPILLLPPIPPSIRVFSNESTDPGIKPLFPVSQADSGEGNGTPLQYSCLENPMDREPGRLQSMGLLRVRHDWATSLSLFTFMHWSRKWQPTPVFLPGESQGRRDLVGYPLWGHIESDTTAATKQQQQADSLSLELQESPIFIGITENLWRGVILIMYLLMCDQDRCLYGSLISLSGF